MYQPAKPARYSAAEINAYMDALRLEYDIVRLVDAEECRIVDVGSDGDVLYGNECFKIWGRGARCANCSSYRACHTHCSVNKNEFLGAERKNIRSIPVELIFPDNGVHSFVVECVRSGGKDEEGARLASKREEESAHTIDVLTRLNTAEYFYKEIRQTLLDNPGKRYMLLLCNIRNFSLFNQLFGTEGGNRLLVEIADILRDEAKNGCVCGRYRDDRFLFFTPLEGFDPQVFAERFQKRLRDTFSSKVFEPFIKVGAYEIVDTNMPIAVMTDHAELAAEHARNSFETPLCVFDETLLEYKLLEQRILTHFEKSMKNGEYQIYLQPQVRKNGKLIGAEALVRWVRPEGVLPPSEFIPVLSRSELMGHLDLHIWEQAASLLGKWRTTKLEGCYISINVDHSDFLMIDVPAELSRLCEKYGADPSSLHVEITETALVNNIEFERNIVERLHAAGFSVSIDDFGKGSSSLSLLKDICADTLKIDMGFLRGTQNPERSRIILGFVVEMAKKLGMNVIAEGVETLEQVESLSNIGCVNFQGFYFSRPIPVCEFEKKALTGF